MRKGVVVAGIVVIVLGALVLGLSFAFSASSTTIPAPSTGTALVFSPNLVGTGSVGLSWSGASSQFRFQVLECTNSACSSTTGGSLANGGGPSGSVSFSATGGQYYEVDASGNSNAVAATIAVSGLTLLLLIGIVIAAIGAVLAFFGSRMKAKVRPVEEAEAAPVPEKFSTRPFTETQVGPAAAAAASAYARPPERGRSESDEASGPVYFEPTGPAADSPSYQPGKGNRPPIQCPSCGTTNDPWLTYCRSCRRPLTTTG